MKLVVADAFGQRQEVAFASEPLTIGRGADNRVRLAEKDVSRRHARIARAPDGRLLVEDLRSLTGIRVNGERIDGPREIGEGDLILISAYALTVEQDAEAAGPIRPGDPPSAAARARAPARPAAARAAGRPDAPRLAKAPPAPEQGPAPLRSAEKPRLVALSEVPRARAWLVERTQVTLGRGQANDICVDHPSVALAHCTLRRTEVGWTLTPAAGVTSLTVNGGAPAGALLGGDVLALGEVQLVFLAPGQPFALPAAAAERALPQRMAPVRVIEAPARASRGNLRLAAQVLAAMGAAAALGASAARLLQRKAPPRAAPPPAADRGRPHSP